MTDSRRDAVNSLFNRTFHAIPRTPLLDNLYLLAKGELSPASFALRLEDEIDAEEVGLGQVSYRDDQGFNDNGGEYA